MLGGNVKIWSRLEMLGLAVSVSPTEVKVHHQPTVTYRVILHQATPTPKEKRPSWVGSTFIRDGTGCDKTLYPILGRQVVVETKQETTSRLLTQQLSGLGYDVTVLVISEGFESFSKGDGLCQGPEQDWSPQCLLFNDTQGSVVRQDGTQGSVGLYLPTEARSRPIPDPTSDSTALRWTDILAIVFIAVVAVSVIMCYQKRESILESCQGLFHSLDDGEVSLSTVVPSVDTHQEEKEEPIMRQNREEFSLSFYDDEDRYDSQLDDL